MKRVELINYLIEKKGYHNYIEIGLFNGGTFKKIKAAYKIGIDPRSNIAGDNIFKMKSDNFFIKHVKLLANRFIEIALIDGLHQYEQVVKDVKNCLKYLSKNGILILHDCNPKGEASAARGNEPAAGIGIPDWDGKTWNGDVWKAIVYLRAYKEDLEISVLDIDQGLGIIRWGNNINNIKIDIKDIPKLNYSDLKDNREEWLNLVKPDDIYNFINTL